MLLELALTTALCTTHTDCVDIATDETPPQAVHCLQTQGWPQQGNALRAPLLAVNQCLAWYPQATQNTAHVGSQGPTRHT